MKTFLALGLTLALGLSSGLAAEPAVYFFAPGKAQKGFLTSVSASTFEWKDNLRSTKINKLRRSEANVYFLEPTELAEAIDLYKGGDYEKAAEQLSEVVEGHQDYTSLLGNPGTLARFYQLECYRHLQDFDRLLEGTSKITRSSLAREHHRNQIEINDLFWRLVKEEKWADLLKACKEPRWAKEVLPGALRVQLEYVEGLALEGLERPLDALDAYNRAIIADFSASRGLVHLALQNCLSIFLKNEEVKVAMKTFKTKDYDPNSDGASYLAEAVALSKLWRQALSDGKSLPDQFSVFQRFEKDDQ